MNKKKLIFICTANSCRSQMAEGLLKEIASDFFDVFSAGSHPSIVHPMSIKVMKEVGIDISSHRSEPISKYLNSDIDIVVTVCDNASATCPTFAGSVQRLHWSIKDPAKKIENIEDFRNARDDIKKRVMELKNELSETI